mgnify:CR=1 FL=1
MVTKPTLIIDKRKCRENINRMYNKAIYHNLEFRPHFKTHQSLEIGSWYRELGVDRITVSSVDMAKYFSKDWDNITIAFPVNILEVKSINALALKITVNLVVENIESVTFLSEHLISNVNIFLKIDIGYHRTGINPDDKKLMDEILKVIDSSQVLSFAGFLGHAGHTYKCRSNEGIKEIHNRSLKTMIGLKAHYKSNYPNLIASLGDTPSCSVADNFTGIDEIRPGNFVFYDLTQNKIGSNSISQIAVALACPIVAIHPSRSEIVIYGGGVHFSKDSLMDIEGQIFGRVVVKTKNAWGDIIAEMYVNRLSQEHGIVSVPKSEIRNYNIGDYLMILPVHSCMTANAMKSYLSTENRIISKL